LIFSAELLFYVKSCHLGCWYFFELYEMLPFVDGYSCLLLVSKFKSECEKERGKKENNCS